MLKASAAAAGGEWDFAQNLGRVRQALVEVQTRIQRTTPRQKTPPKPQKIDKSIQTLQDNVAVKTAEIPQITIQQHQHQQQQSQALLQQPMSVVERLELRFLKQTITQYNEDNLIIYNNFMDSLKVIEVLKKKIEDQNTIIHSSYDQVKLEYLKLTYSHNAKIEEIKNLEKITDHWKQKFERLLASVKQSAEEDLAGEQDNEKIISELTAQNKVLREMLKIQFSGEILKKVQTTIEEAESDFYNNQCSKNPQPSDVEIKFMTSNNKGLNKQFKKFGAADKTFGNADQQSGFEKRKLSTRGSDSTENITLKKTEVSSIEGGESDQGREDIANKSEGKLQQIELKKNQLETIENKNIDGAGGKDQKDKQNNPMSQNELKDISESSNTLQKMVRNLQMETRQEEIAKQAQLRLLGNFTDSRENEEGEANQDEGDADDADAMGEVRVEEEDYEEGENLLVQKDEDKFNKESKSEQIQPVEVQKEKKDSIKTEQELTQIMGFRQQYGNQEPFEHEGQDEQEEEDEYDDEQNHEDSNFFNNSSQPRQEQQNNIRQQSQQIDFKDRARIKELLQMQSKQFTQQIQQMSNPKFFKPSQQN